METVRKLALPLIVAGLVVGVLIGLLLGWQVWPVKWYDTDPSDLRAEHQVSYVLMVSDSLAVTADVELASWRLQALLEEDTTWEDVSALVEQVASERERAGDSAGAFRLRRMAQAVSLPPAVSSTAEPSEEPASRKPLPKWLIIPLVVGAFLVALSIVIWVLMLIIRGRSPRAESMEALESDAEDSFELPMPPVTGEKATGQAPWEDEDITEVSLEAWEAQPDVETTEPPVSPPMGPLESSTMEEPEAEDSLTGELVAKTAAESVSPESESGERRELPPGVLGIFEAEYQFGHDDFDCSFSIEAGDGEFLGECGVGISDVMEFAADDAQQVDAFEIWLFDKEDIRTVSKILVSEYAYNDEALNASLSSKGDLVLAQPGLTIALETLSLHVSATIKEFDYAPDDEFPNGIFSHLNVEMTVEKISDAP